MKKFLKFIEDYRKQFNLAGEILAVIGIVFLIFSYNQGSAANILLLGGVCLLLSFAGEYLGKKNSRNKTQTDKAVFD